MQFDRPVVSHTILVFSIERQGILVDGALSARGIYLQPGRPGDRLKDDIDRPKIFIELPDDSFRDRWEEVVRRRLAQVIRRGKRMPREEARRLAAEWLNRTRELSRFRMPGS